MSIYDPLISAPRNLADIARDREDARGKVTDLEVKAAALAQIASDRLTDGQAEQAERYAVGLERARATLATLDDEYREALKVLARDPRRVDPPFTPSAGVAARPDGPTSFLRAEATRVIDRAFAAGHLPDYAAERATRLLSQGTPYDQNLAARWAAAAGDPSYLSAFAKIIANPQTGHLLFDPKELDAWRAVHSVQSELRAAGFTLGGTGGYMVPLTLDPAIILSSAGTTNAMRKNCRVVQTVTDKWVGVSSAGVSAEWLPTEATQVAEATPAAAPISIPVILGDAYLHASFQSVMDIAAFSSEMQRVLLDAADVLMATAYTTGAGGGNEPKGMITALAATHVDGKGSEVLAATDPFDLQAVLPPRFSPRAVFMAALPIINAYSLFETTNGGRLFPEIGSGRLLNRPLIENSDMDAAINAAATENNYVLAYFDPQQFIIADRIGATLEVIPNVVGANQRPTAERGFLLWFRTGSDMAVVEAGRVLNVATTA